MTKYAVQFCRKGMGYYVDVVAESITEALANANTIDHDFALAPVYERSDFGGRIQRVVLRWDNEHVPFTKDDIGYVYDLTNESEILDFSIIPN